jgi:glycosyltransferase involved in cell wall biosynthesis
VDRRLRILFCSQNPLDPKLGASKVLLELAGELEALGWECRLAPEEEISPGNEGLSGPARMRRFSESLGRFLEKWAGDFDVVDYDHLYLPFPRARFAPRTLLAARVPLLFHHFQRVRFPPVRRLRTMVGTVIRGPYRWLETRSWVRRADRSLAGADLVNVSNDRDRDELVRRGCAPGRIEVLPLGLSEARLASFGPARPEGPASPRVAFVGTFDPRKGAGDLPAIVRRITAEVPGCKFRLLGSRYLDEAYVRGSFPSSLRDRLEVIPRFEPDALPGLLRDCSTGVFPSYVEGFGFGVLEMLAASLPVIAYDAPGAPMMLDREHLVPRGAVREMAQKTVALLRDPGRLAADRAWARARAQQFSWRRAAELTSAAYERGRLRVAEGAS